jgi:hypothetical protein
LVVLHGRLFKDTRDRELDPQTQLDQWIKGVIKDYGTGEILLTSVFLFDEVLLPLDEVIGRMHGRETLKSEAIEEKTHFKIRRLLWPKLGRGFIKHFPVELHAVPAEGSGLSDS